MKNYKKMFLRTACSIAFMATVCTNTAYSQTVDIIGNMTTTTNNALGTNLYAVNESIYMEAEIGAGNFITPASSINQVAFNINTVGTNTVFANITIWMKEIPLATTTFSTGTYSVAGYTQVFTGSVTAAVTGWTAIPLTVPFQRISGNNLQVLIERNDGVAHTGYVYESASGNNTGNTAASSRRYNSTTILSGTTSLTASQFRAQIRLQHNPPLPVSLLSFDVKGSGKINQLNWSTSQELNSKKFIIERGADGRNFSAIGEVTASGNSTAVRNYSFSDNTPARGTNYYRLRVVDIDNSGKYSAIRSIRNEGSADIALYPNPVKTRLNVKIIVDKADKGEVAITDISGKIILNKSVVLARGMNLVPIDINKLAAGGYVMKITLSDGVVIRKFDKQ